MPASVLVAGWALAIIGRLLGHSYAATTARYVYAVLLGFAHLWLGAFRIGPLEWLLRSITEWRWLDLRRGARAAAATPSLAGSHNL